MPASGTVLNSTGLISLANKVTFQSSVIGMVPERSRLASTEEGSGYWITTAMGHGTILPRTGYIISGTQVTIPLWRIGTVPEARKLEYSETGTGIWTSKETAKFRVTGIIPSEALKTYPWFFAGNH